MYIIRTTHPPNAFVRAIGFPRQLYFLPCVCFSLCLFYSSGYVSVLIYPVSSFRWVLATRRDYRRISGVFHWDIEQFTCGAQWTEQLNYDETNLRLINQIIEKTLQHRVYQLRPQEDTNFAEWKRLTQVRCFRLKVWRLQVADFLKFLFPLAPWISLYRRETNLELLKSHVTFARKLIQWSGCYHFVNTLGFWGSKSDEM